MKPTVGRIVHYVSHGSPKGPQGEQVHPSKCRAAIVTDAYGDDLVALAVLTPHGAHFGDHVVHAEPEPLIGGTWHWPEREEEDNG